MGRDNWVGCKHNFVEFLWGLRVQQMIVPDTWALVPAPGPIHFPLQPNKSVMFLHILSVAGTAPPAPGVLSLLLSVWLPYFSFDNQIYCHVFEKTYLFSYLCVPLVFLMFLLLCMVWCTWQLLECFSSFVNCSWGTWPPLHHISAAQCLGTIDSELRSWWCFHHAEGWRKPLLSESHSLPFSTEVTFTG